jgi:hypothetical protein
MTSFEYQQLLIPTAKCVSVFLKILTIKDYHFLKQPVCLTGLQHFMQTGKCLILFRNPVNITRHLRLSPLSDLFSSSFSIVLQLFSVRATYASNLSLFENMSNIR